MAFSLRHARRTLGAVLRPTPALAVLALSALVPQPADADESPADAPPVLEDPWSVSFALETIRVEGLRHAREDLLLAEARLAAGESYDEEALGRAIDRVRRLPFVREAAFALQKGSRRGLYELVIRVEETRRFFFGAALLRTERSDDLLFDPDFRDDDDSGVLAGARFFTGRYGTFFVAAENDRVVAGYARNRLWGRSGSLRVGFEESFGDVGTGRVFGASVDPGLGRWSHRDTRGFTAAFDLPLGAVDRWGVEFESQTVERGVRYGTDLRSSYAMEDFTDRRLTASWLRDTTDDAVFAERGLRQAVAVTARLVEADFVPTPFDDLETTTVFTSRSLRLGFLRSRWWTPIARHTVWGSVDVAAALTEVEGLPVLRDPSVPGGAGPWIVDTSYESVELAASAGHRVRLFAGRPDEDTGIPRGAFREVYWETTFRASRDEAFGDDVGGVLIQIDATTGVVWRTSWGLFRLGLRFVDVERDP